jgi:hypothetical protein
LPVIEIGLDQLSPPSVVRENIGLPRKSAALASQFVGEELADIELERLGVEMGEVLVSALGEVLEPAHA